MLKRQKIKKAKGVTLIELMLAVAISLILLLGVGSVYYNSKRTYNIQEEFARLQESSRFALKFLVEDIRMAGFVGCAWSGDLNASHSGVKAYESFLKVNDPPTDDDNYLSNFNVGMEGLEAAGTDTNETIVLNSAAAAWDRNLPSFITNAPSAGSDILIVRYADGNGVQLTRNKASANFWIDAENEAPTEKTIGTCHIKSGICEGDVLIVTDCTKSRQFQLTDGMTGDTNEIKLVHSGSGDPGNAEPSWGGASGKHEDFEPEDSTIFRAAAYAYYVAPGTGPNGEPSLFRQELRPGIQPEELVEGIENMQVLYGIDTERVSTDGNDDNGPEEIGDGIANRYVSADQVTLADDNVVSARISLLVRTGNEIASKDDAVLAADQFTLLGLNPASGVTVTTPADRRLRKVFTTTVKIRNKGLR